MSKINRRVAMTSAVVAGATVASAAGGSMAAPTGDVVNQEPELTKDQKYIMEAGLDEKEAEAWKKAAEAAGAFFALPELHPMDKQEVATAIHVIQNKLLGRPTYRKYLKVAKEGYEKERNKKKKE